MTAIVEKGFRSETIEGARRCVIYTGMAGGLTTFNGIAVIVLATSQTDLVAAMREINPELIKIDTTKFLPAALIRDCDIIRTDNEL